jgi:hypothetical protein
MESEGRSQCGSTALGFGFEAHHRRRDHRATCLSSSAGNACVMLPPCAGRGAGWGGSMVETSSLNAFRPTGSGALGGTRTPNLLIRRRWIQIQSVQMPSICTGLCPVCPVSPVNIEGSGQD